VTLRLTAVMDHLTDSAGYWCDPYWGCAVVGNAQFSNQFELSAGLTLRF